MADCLSGAILLAKDLSSFSLLFAQACSTWKVVYSFMRYLNSQPKQFLADPKPPAVMTHDC